jgi:Zn-dependent protease with chaperone function
MAPIKLKQLKAKDYIHPKDQKALHTLKDTKGLDSLVKKFYDMGVERLIKLQYTGSGIKATYRNFPDIIETLYTALEVLNVQAAPEIYIQRSEELEATTLGVEHPIIVLTSESINVLTREELLYIIGREVAHIQQNHVLYNEIGFIFPQLIDTLSYVTFGLSGILSGGLRYALFYWSQMAEYSADRGGLLACQDVQVAKLMMAKIAGLPEKMWHNYDLDDFEQQAQNFEGFNENTFDKFVRFMYGNNLWAVARTKELMNWMKSGQYSQLLARKGDSKWIQ